jgi:hypothetical protein
VELASRQLVVPHRWGTRLGVWSRTPAQRDPLANGKPGIDVAFPLLSVSVHTPAAQDITCLLLPRWVQALYDDVYVSLLNEMHAVLRALQVRFCRRRFHPRVT